MQRGITKSSRLEANSSPIAEPSVKAVSLKRNNKNRHGENHKARETGRTPQEEIQVRAVAIALKVFWPSIEVGTDGIMGNLTIGIVNRTEGITPMRKANRMLPMAVPVNEALTMINPMSFLTKRGLYNE